MKTVMQQLNFTTALLRRQRPSLAASSSFRTAMSPARLDGLDLVRECEGGGSPPPSAVDGVDAS